MGEFVNRFGDTILHTITQAEVADWRRRMIDDGLKNATVNRMSGILRSIISRAREDGREVTTLSSKSLKEDPGRVRFLTDAEETRLLDECAPHIRNVVQFLMDSGARIGETLALTGQDHLGERPGCSAAAGADDQDAESPHQPLNFSASFRNSRPWSTMIYRGLQPAMISTSDRQPDWARASYGGSPDPARPHRGWI